MTNPTRRVFLQRLGLGGMGLVGLALGLRSRQSAPVPVQSAAPSWGNAGGGRNVEPTTTWPSEAPEGILLDPPWRDGPTPVTVAGQSIDDPSTWARTPESFKSRVSQAQLDERSPKTHLPAYQAAMEGRMRAEIAAYDQLLRSAATANGSDAALRRAAGAFRNDLRRLTTEFLDRTR